MGVSGRITWVSGGNSLERLTKIMCITVAGFSFKVESCASSLPLFSLGPYAKVFKRKPPNLRFLSRYWFYAICSNSYAFELPFHMGKICRRRRSVPQKKRSKGSKLSFFFSFLSLFASRRERWVTYIKPCQNDRLQDQVAPLINQGVFSMWLEKPFWFFSIEEDHDRYLLFQYQHPSFPQP